MSNAADLTPRYDRAAPDWGDKMRVLGYADAYLGFLATGPRGAAGTKVCDVGCGTGAFAESWVGIYGTDAPVTLLDPSAKMLAEADRRLRRRGLAARLEQQDMALFEPARAFDHLLMAHVIEHLADPVAALGRMRKWVRPGGRLSLVVSKPHWCNAIIWLQWRHRAYREAEVAAILQAAGWRLDTTYAFPSGPPSRTSRGYRATAI